MLAIPHQTAPRYQKTRTTYFAPAGRDPKQIVAESAAMCANNPVTQMILASIDGLVLILNDKRQVLAVNDELLRSVNITDTDPLLGFRPGEILHCSYSAIGPDGCGTSRQCATCGAAIAILASQKNRTPAVNECLLSINCGREIESREFRVRSTPVVIEGQNLLVFLLHDISDMKRRSVLENVFIHDMLNLITGLNGWCELLKARPDDSSTINDKIVRISGQLTQEIQNQRLLMRAERGDLSVEKQPTEASAILKNIYHLFSGYPQDHFKRLQIQIPDEHIFFETSMPLLSRVIANMVKNALEATVAGDTVKVWFEASGGSPSFHVHNPGVIPENMALQIFKRSFSTKASSGRGLGTYSMKLFGEKYLGGKVFFTTDPQKGTTFSILLPDN